VAHIETIHHDKVIRLCEFAGERGEIRNQAFEDCYIKGPAVLVLEATRPGSVRLHNNTFEGDMNAVLWEVDTQKRPQVIGAILCVDCEFDGCTFARVGLAGPPDFVQRFRG
jgi:hypothetical protein